MAGKLKIEVARQDFYRLSLLDDAGKLVGTPVGPATSNDANLRKWSKKFAAPVDWLEARIADVLNGTPGPFDLPAATSATPCSEFRVRGRTRPDTEAKAFPTFAEALAAVPDVEEPLIAWRGTDAVACLDVDFHGAEWDGRRPTPGDLLQFWSAWHPRPAFAWSSHGRGIHAIFLAADRWTAGELAAVAAFAVAKRWPGAGFEVKSDSRHPAVALTDGRTCGDVLEQTPDADPSVYLRDLMRFGSDASTVTNEHPEVEDWLRGRGFVVGMRYAHDYCPIHPSPHGKREPVIVYRDAVYCHVCRTKGGRFMQKFADLVSEGIPHDAAELAKKWVHWQHARHVLAQQFEGPIAKLAYRVALKIHHDTDDKDPRIAAAMDDENEMLRFDGFWASRNGEAFTKELPAMLAGLPACQGPDGSPMARRVARFAQTAGLEEFGYRAITPIWGCRIGTVNCAPRDPDAPHVVCYPQELRTTHVNRRPQYLDREDRLPIDQAWAELERPFPGIPRAYIELLIAAKGCAELGKEKPPMLYVSGPSGAGKTSSVMIAASICGDVCTDVVWSPQSERFRQGIMSAASSGTFCCVNEAVKNGRVHHQTPVDVMDAVLNFTERSVSHKLYVGAVPLGRLPVFVWTETDLPEDLRHDKQLARRLVWVEMASQVRWEETQVAYGVDKPDRVRIAGDAFARACDAILSHVIDTYFPAGGSLTFESIARQLGFYPMQASAEASASGELRDFYAVVQASPTLPAGHQGAGWVNIDLSADTKLATIWRGLSDADGLGSRKCAAEDWGKLLGSSSPVKFEVRRNGRSVAVRFSGNVVTRPVQLESRPVADGADRPGDAECGGHPFRLAGIPAASFLPADVFGREAGAPLGGVDTAGEGAG